MPIDAIPLPLDVVELPDLLLEPPHRLRTFRMDLEADHVHLQLLLIGLLEQLVPAAFPVPAVVVDEVHPEERPVGQGDERGQLPDDVPGRGVPRVEDPAAHRVLDLEGRNDRPRGRHLDLEPPAGGLLDRRHQQLGGVVGEYAERPGGLHLPPIGAWAVAGVGVLYQPATKARMPTRIASAIADFTDTSLRIGPSPVRVRNVERWRDSSEGRRGLSMPKSVAEVPA